MKKIVYLFFIAIVFGCNQPNNTSNSATQGDGTDGSILNVITDPKDDLVGEYAFKEGGRAEIRITKDNGSYFVSVGKNEKWERPEQLENVTDKDFIELFGQNWKSYVKAGLHKDMFGIFKVEKGFKNNNHTFTTGYFVMFIGGGDVYKLTSNEIEKADRSVSLVQESEIIENPVLDKTYGNEGFYCNGFYDVNPYGENHIFEDIDLKNLKTFTICCQFKVDENRKHYLFTLGRSSRLLSFLINVDNSISLSANNQAIVMNTNSEIVLNKWFLATMTFNNGLVEMYLNDKKIGEKSLTLTAFDKNDYNISSINYSNGIAFKGYIKNLLVYNTALNESSIKKMAAIY